MERVDVHVWVKGKIGWLLMHGEKGLDSNVWGSREILQEPGEAKEPALLLRPFLPGTTFATELLLLVLVMVLSGLPKELEVGG